MFIEIISVSKKTEQDMLPDREDELRLSLAKYGYSLKAIKKTIMHPTLINAELSNIAKSDDKPDVVIIANALRTKDARAQLIAQYQESRRKAASAKNEFITKDDEENIKQFTDAMGDLSDAFQSLTTGMSESSAAYKALFAIQKGFAVASATANAIVAWTKALSTSATWYESLANYANAVALTANIIGQLKSLTMHDKGGRIPAGQLGIVGEYGPELIQGPVDVTSRKRTAELARQAAGGTVAPVTVNLYENAERAGQVEQQDNTDGERIINIFVSNIRRGGAAARAMENTYQLRRFGA